MKGMKLSSLRSSLKAVVIICTLPWIMWSLVICWSCWRGRGTLMPVQSWIVRIWGRRGRINSIKLIMIILCGLYVHKFQHARCQSSGREWYWSVWNEVVFSDNILKLFSLVFKIVIKGIRLLNSLRILLHSRSRTLGSCVTLIWSWTRWVPVYKIYIVYTVLVRWRSVGLTPHCPLPNPLLRWILLHSRRTIRLSCVTLIWTRCVPT